MKPLHYKSLGYSTDDLTGLSDIKSLVKALNQISVVWRLRLINEKDLRLVKPSIKRLEYKRNITFSEKSLKYWAFHADNRYHKFKIPKKTGGFREITAPEARLKAIQHYLNELLGTTFTPHKCAYGFTAGRSIVDNAKPHVGKTNVLNVDIKNFFPSIDFRRVKVMLQNQPFNFSDDVAYIIANLCSFEGVLPQGAPTSPLLSNVVCQRLDSKLDQFAAKHNCAYSRYADDITLSSYRTKFSQEHLEDIDLILKEEKFELNHKKTRIQYRSKRQEVTGLVVNQKVNVHRTFVKDIRYWLRTWDTFGIEATQLDFYKRFPTKKGYRRGVSSRGKVFHKYLKGKIEFLGHVRGHGDPLYHKFKSNYEKLLAGQGLAPKDVEIDISDDSLEEILHIWENEGIESAIRKYSRKKE